MTEPNPTSQTQSTDPRSGPANGDLPMPKPRVVICPYCGCRTEEAAACSRCRGRFDPLSRQATQNSMGPWWVRDENRPNAPGCNFASLLRLIRAGSVGPESVVRGPTTRQFWMLARHTPGVANRLGVCHNCGKEADAEDYSCGGCGAVFTIEPDRQFLGLGPVRDLGSTPMREPVGAPPRPEPSPPHSLGGSAAKGAGPGAVGPGRGPLVVPRPRRISQRRLAVNLMVGCAVFVLVVGLVLTTLNIMPNHLFKDRGLETADAEDTLVEASPGGTGDDSIASFGTPSGPVGAEKSGARQLLSFGPSGDGSESEAPNPKTELEASAAEPEADEARPVVSREQRVFERSIEVLRLGDPAAIRESILAVDGLLASPRVPDWAPPMRERLQTRLERLQFARLP